MKQGTLPTTDDLVSELRAQLDRSPSGKAGVAARLGLGEQQLTKILRGQREICDQVAGALGYRKVVRFERVE